MRAFYKLGLCLLAVGFMASPGGNAIAAAVCSGVVGVSCGETIGTDGVVSAPSGSTSFRWISTYGGQTGVGQLPGVPAADSSNGYVGGTNGTTYTTSPFTATPNSILNYNFNYVTSDGSNSGGFIYADYAWAQLRDTANHIIATLVTAQTQPTTSPLTPIIPATKLGYSVNPAVTLNPSPVYINNTNPITSAIYQPVPAGGGNGIGPVWSPLGDPLNVSLSGWSGTCWGDGCGYTGWVNSRYTITSTDISNLPSGALFVLVFGVSNWGDELWDSGLAFNGLTVAGKPIPGEGEGEEISSVPVPAALPLFATGLGALGLLGWRRKKKAQANAA